ncbi:MBL fold metallo-hydrolase [Desmospora profundinema]|uniref:MBL fold metallo-hydrolase n=1 Tax=Desmospora profundinema TaxID=1571184 RepID=UPI0035B51A78
MLPHCSDQIGKPITRIVLTHVHHDHIGALDALKQAILDVSVHISSREARLLVPYMTWRRKGL